MTNKRYTDEEIIEALEGCLCDNPECLECQKKELGRMECDELITKTLDLIIRKTEEIESLKAELSNTRRKALLEASSKFAGHSNYHGDTILCKLICMAEGQEVGIAIPLDPLDMSGMKAEAYKEFAEKLENEINTRKSLSTEQDKNVIRIMHNLLKEMVGEEK